MLNWFAKKLKEAREEEGGFTLIELLVVVIIIGILAAIAIPIFLNQRATAQDNAARANLNNAATAQASFLAQNNGFANTAAEIALLPNFGFPTNSTPAVTGTPTDTAFCYRAVSDSTAIFVVRNTATTAAQVGTGTPAVADCT